MLRCLSILMVALAIASHSVMAEEDDEDIQVLGMGGREDASPAPLPSGARVQSGPAPGQERLVISPDGARVATAGKDGMVRVFDAATAKMIVNFKAHENGCSDVEFSADGKTLFSSGADMFIREWDAENKKELRKFEGHEAEVRNVAISIDGRLMASSDAAGTIRVWDLKTGQQLKAMKGHGVELPPGVEGAAPIATIDNISFSPDGRTILSEADDETARLWDVVKGEMRLTLPKHDGSTAALLIGPDGATGASTRGAQLCSYGTAVRIWAVSDGKVHRVLTGHTADVTCVTFSSDGRYIFTGARDKTLRQWEVNSGLEIRRFVLSSPPMGVVCTPNDKSIVSVSPREGIAVWDITTAPRPVFKDPSGILQARAEIAPAAGDGDALWQKLDDPAYEVRASTVEAWLQKPKDAAVAELSQRLSAAPRAEDVALVKQAIDDLDSDNYSMRLEAFENLAQLGGRARPALEAACESPSLEVRTQAAKLLKGMGGPRDVRLLTIIEMLPLINTPAAKELLSKLAAPLTSEGSHARAILKRW